MLCVYIFIHAIKPSRNPTDHSFLQAANGSTAPNATLNQKLTPSKNQTTWYCAPWPPLGNTDALAELAAKIGLDIRLQKVQEVFPEARRGV